MRTNLIFGFLLLLVGLLSCENKEENQPNIEKYDTIKPLAYFPALPGSYWIYDNNDTLKVADHYEKYIFNAASYDAVPDYDTLVLPKLILNGIFNSPDTFAYVREYSLSKSNGSGYRDPAFKEMLSLNQGEKLIIGGAFQDHCIVGRVVKTDTTMMINGVIYNNVIVTIHYDESCTMHGLSENECAWEREYFARDIGLIKRETKAYPDTIFKKDIELIGFEIKR